MKTSELIGPALDWAVAKADGRVLHVPDAATNEDLEKLQTPFKLYGVTCTIRDKKQHWAVEEVIITRFGIDRSVGATAPSITFTDEKGHVCRGSASLFYLKREHAQLSADEENLGGLEGFEPSVCWDQGGPIIEREGIGTEYIWNEPKPDWLKGQRWVASHSEHMYVGPTPLIAAMRCFVASKLGDEVEIPKELV